MMPFSQRLRLVQPQRTGAKTKIFEVAPAGVPPGTGEAGGSGKRQALAAMQVPAAAPPG